MYLCKQGMLGPIMMIREPLFQVYLLGMDEVGIRERPFGPKEEPEEVEEPKTEEVSDCLMNSWTGRMDEWLPAMVCSLMRCVCVLIL